MRNLSLFLHIAAAIFWMGGMAFMVLALRPALGALEPPVRWRLLAHVMRRFFVVVSLSTAVLLATGAVLLALAGAATPPGWDIMAALGILMMAIFGHLRFVPYKRFGRAVAAEDWPAAGAAAMQIALLVKINLGLGWLAIAAVLFWR